MRKYLFIAIGGMFGAISRFSIKNINIWDYHGSIPLNTLFVNITGSFLLALILTITIGIWNFNIDIRLGIAIGFLGAYTTFSTICKETAILIEAGNYFSAISYIILSTILGLAVVYFGIASGRKTLIILERKNKVTVLKIDKKGQ